MQYSPTNGWVVNARTTYVDIPTVTLTVDRNGTGTGGVTAAGLSGCGGGANTQAVPCGASYAHNTVVTLTAVPDSGSAFAGWSGGGCSGFSTCAITMSNAKFVSAMFTKNATSYVASYYHVDRIGSVRAMTDAAGNLVGPRHDYAPFGEDTQPLAGNPMRFGGKELDAETAFHYFEARYYGQTWGRFTQVDPAGGWQTDPQSWNAYAYARNNPLKYVDPTGLAYYVFWKRGDFKVETEYYEYDEDFWRWAQMNCIRFSCYGDYWGGAIYDSTGGYLGEYEWVPGIIPTPPSPTPTPGPPPPAPVPDPPTAPGPGPGPGPTCFAFSACPVPAPPPGGPPVPPPPPPPPPPQPAPSEKAKKIACLADTAVNTAIGSAGFAGAMYQASGARLNLFGSALGTADLFQSEGGLFNKGEVLAKTRADAVEEGFSQSDYGRRAIKKALKGNTRAGEAVAANRATVGALRSIARYFAIAGGIYDAGGCLGWW